MAKVSGVKFQITSIDIVWTDVSSINDLPESVFVMGATRARGEAHIPGMELGHSTMALTGDELQHLQAILASVEQRFAEKLKEAKQ